MKAITITNGGVRLTGGIPQRTDLPDRKARHKTIAGQILDAHNASGSEPDKLRLKFDALVSHDITYVGIIQTATTASVPSEAPSTRTITYSDCPPRVVSGASMCRPISLLSIPTRVRN